MPGVGELVRPEEAAGTVAEPAILRGRTLGIDLGIGSCGWAVIDESEPGGAIAGMGVRMFDVPETSKERTPTNQLRRQQRGQRRVLRRRRQRMLAIRRLLYEFRIIPDVTPAAVATSKLDPWDLRVKGLDRRLSDQEFAVVLVHIAKHRGFQSNSKRDRAQNAPPDSKKMLSAAAANQERLQHWRSVGEMFAKEPDFATRKRNRDGEYTHSVLREDLVREIRLLFGRQRAFGNASARSDLEEHYIEIAFAQRPIGDSEDKVGFCPFESGERRTAKAARSFELFRLLSRLAALRVVSSRTARSLTGEEIARASRDFGAQRGITFARLRRILGLTESERFDGIPQTEEKDRDVVARRGDANPGSYALRKVLGPVWESMVMSRPDVSDRIAEILTFRDDISSIEAGLRDCGLEPPVLDAILNAARYGAFAGFRGAGHISAKACRALIPHLARGLVYSEACAATGYDHARQPEISLDDVRNPIARKAITEALKQIRAVVRAFGIPARIHVELARDVGKGREERDEIKRGIEDRVKEKEKLKIQFAEVAGHPPAGPEDLLRFELWREQNGRCLYTDEAIHPRQIVAADNSVQVDHILPWSRSGDDSFHNKTLCTAKANQDKRGATPYDWLSGDQRVWQAFEARVESNKALSKKKRRNLLLRDASVLDEKFRPRNLNDTRYAARQLLALLKRHYPEAEVRARPGALTDRLRRGWGVQHLKKDAQGNRVQDERHHALDALVVAATTESALQRLTRAFQEAERLGSHRDFSALEPPWPGFVEQTKAALLQVMVSRGERGRARGEAHAATIRQIAERGGVPVVYERKPVEKLTLKDLDRIKDPERNAAVTESLRRWIEAGKPADAPPRSPKGDVIRKVRLGTKDKPGVQVGGGDAARGEIVRVDVFRRRNAKGVAEYSVVPVYPHQIADRARWPKPPNLAVRANKSESEWELITEAHEFLWSLYPFSFIEVETREGIIISGYFRSLDRSTGAITISVPYSSGSLVRGIGVRTLRSFEKFAVDRLGHPPSRIEREARTWHGVVCT